MDQLHETHGIYQDVIEALDADTMLDEAMWIANSHKVEVIAMSTEQD